MLRLSYRFGVVAGFVVMALLLTGATLARPFDRSDTESAIDEREPQQASTIAPNFTIDVSAIVPNGLSQPVAIANAGDGSGRLFVAEQAGYVRIIKNGALLSTPYLTLTSKVSCCGERGLLSIAFDPNYSTNGIFYVYYTALNGDVTIERYVTTNPASDVANISSSTIILTVAHPAGNHNGGQLQFGPDGYLYTGLGDGGGSNDQHGPIGNGQNPATLLGKILRLNVRNVATYTVPATNPFTQTVSYRPEIWALGVRNPWRFSFDRATGDLYIGDVGQNCWEEIDYQPASSHGGENYGWRLEEGSRIFDPGDDFNCNQPVSTLVTTTKPITAYTRNSGNVVTGGYVYRGQQYPWMRGVYFFGDSGSSRIWTAQQTAPGVWVTAQKLLSGLGATAFGEDENGELYVTDYGGGGIYKITSPSPINFAGSSKKVSTNTVVPGQSITYTIVLSNSGQPFYETVRVTDTVPSGLAYTPGSLSATLGAVDASAAPLLKWSGVLSNTRLVTITYRASVTAQTGQVITNVATIDPVINPPLVRTALLTVNAVDFSASHKQASAATATVGEFITYAIAIRNANAPFTPTVHVTDTIPTGLSYQSGSLTATLGTVDAASAPTLKWNGVLSNVNAVTITYVVSVSTSAPAALINQVIIAPETLASFTRSALVIANSLHVLLPLVMKND